MGKVKEVEVVQENKLKLWVGLTLNLESELIKVLRTNFQSFTWTSTDMLLGIDPNFLCHHLNVDQKAKAKVLDVKG